MLLFHHEFLEEKTGRPGLAGWYVLEIADPNNTAGVAKMVDDQFRNSSAPTKTGTEQAFNASFATMWGNVSLLMGTIGMAVVFAILLVTANAMMMSARERTKEVAVLKTIGFTDRRLFGLVMLETAIITLTGAVIGLGGAKLLYKASNFNAAGLPARLRRDHRYASSGSGGRPAVDARQRAGAGDSGRPAPGGSGAEDGRMKIPLTYNARSLLQRPVSTALTALGIGLVVAVFIGMLALANGFRAALTRTGSSQNALVLRRGSRLRAVQRPGPAGHQHPRLVAPRGRPAPTAARW